MKKKKVLTYFSLAASLIILAVGLTHMAEIWKAVTWGMSVLSPIIIGLCLAFVLNVIMSAIEKRLLFPLERSNKKFLRKLKRPIAIILTLVVAFGFVAMIISFIYPSLRQSIDIIIKNFPTFMTKITDYAINFLNEHNIQVDFIEETGINWMAIGDKVISWVKNNSGNILNITTGVAGNIFATIFDFILAFILAIYVLAGKERIRDFFHNFLKAVFKANHVSKVEKISKLTYASFAKFITGQITEAVILGVLCAIGMLILKIPMASVVSVIVGVTALIPMFGAWIGGALGMFFILMVDPVKALVFIVFLLILQQIEGNVIYPKVVGDSIGLPGILVLCAVTIGGGVAGIGGILFSVPITSVVYTLIREFIEKKRLERNKVLAELIEDESNSEEIDAIIDSQDVESLMTTDVVLSVEEKMTVTSEKTEADSEDISAQGDKPKTKKKNRNKK